MSSTGTYRAAKRDTAVADEFLSGREECAFCRHMAARDDLSRFGARCGPCFSAWRAAANPAWLPDRAFTPEERARLRQSIRTNLKKLALKGSGSRDWAYLLRHREAAGEALSRAQRAIWRDALGLPADHPAVEPSASAAPLAVAA